MGYGIAHVWSWDWVSPCLSYDTKGIQNVAMKVSILEKKKKKKTPEKKKKKERNNARANIL